MRLSNESPRVRWLLMAAGWGLVATLLLLHTLAVRDYQALIDAQGLRGATVSPTPLQHTLPLTYADAQMWVLNALDLQEKGGARVRFTHVDNPPEGREVHWSSLLTWLIAGAGQLRHALTGEPLTLATERVLPWINFGLLLGLVIGFSAWTARRAGAAAGLLIALGMIGHRDFYDGFAPYYVDHHGLVTTAVFGLVLGTMFMGGGWWQAEKQGAAPSLLPTSARAVNRAALASALCGAVGLWISAASVIPAIIFVAAAALAVTFWWGRTARGDGVHFSADAWRLWGRVGGVGSLFFYLLEYAPAHFGWRLEVNHPVYALAWWGGAEFVALLAEWRLGLLAPRRPTWSRWIAPTAAVAAAPVVLWVGGMSVFVVRDPFVGALSNHVLEGLSLPAHIRHYGWAIFTYHINACLLPLIPAIGLLFRRGVRERLALGFTVWSTLGFLALAVYQTRFWSISAGPQLCLALVALAALTQAWRPPLQTSLVAATVLGLFLPNTFHRWWEVRQNVRQGNGSQLEGAPVLHRDLAATLRASKPAGEIVLLACPTTSSGISYYGRIKALGTLYWENYRGLRTAAEIFSATTENEARVKLQAKGVTHIVLTTDEDFLLEFFTLLRPDAPAGEFEKTFGYQLLFKQHLPLWLRLVPYAPPPELRRPDLRVLVLQVVPEQTEPEALYHLAAGQLALGQAAAAEGSLTHALSLLPETERAAYALRAGNLCYQSGARATAARLYRAGLPHGANVTLATNLAWLLATDPDASVRHAADALALAERCVAAWPNDFTSHNVFAAALAENARWPEAVAAAQRALGLARAQNDFASAEILARRLQAYASGQPWRQ